MSTGYESGHKELLDLVRQTHEIFVGLKGKDICLISSDPPGRTDCESYIGLPLEDPDVALIHKHEWMHIFFKTNLRARSLFVVQYTDKLAHLTQTLNQHPGYEAWRNQTENFLHTLANALDDLRVSSLWYRIYPYSADTVRERWKRMLNTHVTLADDLVSYIMMLGLGMEPRRSIWEKHEGVFREACTLVEGAGFPAVLVATKLVVDTMLQDALDLLGQPTQAQAKAPRTPQDASAGPKPGRLGVALRKLARRAASEAESPALAGRMAQKATLDRAIGARGPTGFNDTPLPPSGSDAAKWETQAMVASVLGVTGEAQIQRLVDLSATDMEWVTERLRGRTVSLTESQLISKGIPDLILRDLGRRELDETVLEPQDSRLVEAMRHKFARLQDRRTRRSDSSGNVLNPTAYIEMTLGSGDMDIFDDEVSSKGFSALVLIDMSSSMLSKWNTVARAAKVLAKSMKFPFSQYEVWGFSGTSKGETVLFRFKDVLWGYAGSGLKRGEAWGMTPLHVASAVAARRMKQMSGSAQHLFILTDGYPTSYMKSRSVLIPHRQLMDEVGRVVGEIRRRGVNVATLVVGSDISDDHGDQMFGKRHWSRVSSQEPDLFRGMVSLVEKAFVTYLRHR
jgi:hypothetical protein